MKNFEKLDSIRKEKGGSPEMLEELKAMISQMLETADQMLDRVPEVVLRNIAVCGESVDLNACPGGQKYTISYVVDDDDVEVVMANDEELQKLEAFREFMLKRYGLEWSFTRINFNMENIYVASHSTNSQAAPILLEQLEKVFPNIEIET